MRGVSGAGEDRVKQVLHRLSDWTDALVRWVAIPVGLATICLVFFEVLMRYVFQAPLITSVELARLGFVWSCFLGAALGVKREKHIRFVFLLEKLPARGAAALRVAVAALCNGFFLLVLIYGIQMVERVWETYFPALGFSQLWLYLPLPLSAAAMLIHGAAFLTREIAALPRRPRGEQ
jgi:TRAP-type C4-dicarboxylate transport system permease small subunit